MRKYPSGSLSMLQAKPISVIIADDHKLFRSGIISLLEDVSDILIIDEATNGNELIEKYNAKKPDVIVVDISMPELNGVDAFRRIKLRDREVKALFLTMFEGEEYIYHTLRIGGMGLLGKNVVKGELIYAIKTIYNGEKYFGKNYTPAQLKELQKKYKLMATDDIENLIDLTIKEKKILEYLSTGKTSNEIATLVGLSKKSIDYYRSKIMLKLNIKNLPELISFAIKYSNSNKIFNK